MFRQERLANQNDKITLKNSASLPIMKGAKMEVPKDVFDDLIEALILAKDILVDGMKKHSLYPSVGNFAFITETLGRAEEVRRTNNGMDKGEGAVPVGDQ